MGFPTAEFEGIEGIELCCARLGSCFLFPELSALLTYPRNLGATTELAESIFWR